MRRLSLYEVLHEAAARNSKLSTSYKEAARKSLSRPASSLASTAASQRHELGEELDGLLSKQGEKLQGIEVQIDQEFPQFVPESEDVPQFIASIRDIERGEQLLFNSLGGQLGESESELQARFASFAEQARKRADMASDHLDLLALS